MMFVATLVHTPELCLARKELSTEFKQWADGMNDLANKPGIRFAEHKSARMSTQSISSLIRRISILSRHSSPVSCSQIIPNEFLRLFPEGSC